MKPGHIQPSWDVEDALVETTTAIEEGCGALELPPEASEGVQTRLRSDYERQYDDAQDWEHDKARVLPLARTVGALAVVATMAHYMEELLDGRVAMPPTEVRQQDVYDALKFVATYLCPTPKVGGYCGDNGAAANELVEFQRLIASPAAYSQV